MQGDKHGPLGAERDSAKRRLFQQIIKQTLLSEELKSQIPIGDAGDDK